MKAILILVVLVITICCSKDEKNEFPETTDERLSVYSSILDDLVTNHFYNLYLGEDIEKLDEKFNRDRNSPAYREQVENLKSLVQTDTARQLAICLEYKFSVIRFTQLWKEGFKDSLAGLSKHLKDSSIHPQAIYDSLISPQTKFLTDCFQPSSYRVEGTDCSIGSIIFSRISFNQFRDKGLLYYEFYCGEKCGKGEVLLIEKRAGRWSIQRNVRLWVS